MTTSTPQAIERRVIDIVADALSKPIEEVKPHSSLMDDLAAESIDFIDIVFRLETEFDTVIPSERLWAGSIDVRGNDPDSLSRAVDELRARMPDFAWDRFAGGVTRRDLPRLITINTIVSFLEKHLRAEGKA